MSMLLYIVNLLPRPQVFCVHSEPNYSLPWQRKRQFSSTGSGFLLPDRRILTNAHCVDHHSQVRRRAAFGSTSSPWPVSAGRQPTALTYVRPKSPQLVTTQPLKA